MLLNFYVKVSAIKILCTSSYSKIGSRKLCKNEGASEVDVEMEEAEKKTHWPSANDRLKYSGAAARIRGVGRPGVRLPPSDPHARSHRRCQGTRTMRFVRWLIASQSWGPQSGERSGGSFPLTSSIHKCSPHLAFSIYRQNVCRSSPQIHADISAYLPRHKAINF